MSAAEDELDVDERPPAPEEKPKRKHVRTTGARSGGKTAGRPPTQRFQRRAEKARETVRELVRIRMPELDVSELSFVETVDRDADAWGDFLAQLGEWLVPFGTFLDLVFGVGLVRVLRIAPSFRAGRRELVERRQKIAAERAAAAEDEELRERIAAEHAAARSEGIFAEQPAQPAEQPLTREEWLAGNGGE